MNKKPAGFFGPFVVGVAFTAGWRTCIGLNLASILMVAATSGQVGGGTILLTFYSLGLGLHFQLSGLLFDRFLSTAKRLRHHMRKIEIGTGVMLMAVVIMLMFNLLLPITMFFYRCVPVLS